MLDNKLGISNPLELVQAEEKITKQKAKELYDSGDICKIEVGTFKGLAFIHKLERVVVEPPEYGWIWFLKKKYQK